MSSFASKSTGNKVLNLLYDETITLSAISFAERNILLGRI